MSRFKSKAPVVAFVLAFTLTAAKAQTPMAGHDMGQMKEVPPPEKLPTPIAMTGIGNSHLTITATPEAQAWFDQGLNLYHDFWDYESMRAFEQAIRLDPNCAMCFWGLSHALHFRGAQDAYANQALESAKDLKKHVTKKEQLYIEASDADADDNSKKAIKIYNKIIELDPSDLQAKIFLAGELHDGYTDAGEPKPGTAKSIAVLEEVLKAAPNDSAANHYWIHAMEPSNHPERALESAKLLASLAPASGHMVHMPGHIFYRTGDYASAEIWFVQSTAIDEAYMQAQHVDVDDDWNYPHNMMYGIANLMEEGKMAQAAELSAKLPGARGELSATLYNFNPRDNMTRLSPSLPVAMRTADWPTILKLLANAKPEAKLENLNFLAGQLREFATGMQAVQTDNIAAAEASSKKLDDALAAMKAKLDAMPKPEKGKHSKPQLPVKERILPDATAQPLVASLNIMSLELRGSIATAKKDIPKAKDLFTQAAKAEKDLGYREPPIYIRPVGETEGQAMLRAGDAKAAHTAYEAALIERPNSGFSLYGLARSSEASGDATQARKEYQQFLTAWQHSDSGTEQRQHAEAFLSVSAKAVAKN